MKANIHPEYKNIEVTCGCGNTFAMGTSLRQTALRIDVCDKCHPYYTGTFKLLDTTGQVERFKNRYQQAAKKEDGAHSAA